MEKRLEFNEELYLCFVDFAQTYDDSIWRTGVWELLPRYGVHDKIVKLLQALYSIVSAGVRIDGEESDM